VRKGLHASFFIFAIASGCQTAATPTNPPPVVGDVDSAAAKYPDLRTFWARSVARTCGPNNGVCHDNRQFPDMQTASGLLDAINKRCNQIRDDPKTIDNLCEPKGDQLQIGNFVTRVGFITPSPAMNPQTVTLTLHDAIPSGASGAMAIVREPAGLPKLSIAVPANSVMAAKAGAKEVTLSYAMLTTPAPGGTLQRFLVPPLYVPGDLTQVEAGDPNGDGVFGADLDGALIKPGAPMKSYLFLRILKPIALGEMETNVLAPPSEEAQMPIANFQYWDLPNSETALWCWITTMKPDGSNADGPIDYAGCDTSGMPAATAQPGEATTFSSVYATIFASQCSACHHTGTPQPTTLYMDSLQETYDTLLGIRGAGPSENMLGLPYVTKSDPTKSYLYMKLTGAPGITGARMPLGGELPQTAIDSVGNWIAQGANND